MVAEHFSTQEEMAEAFGVSQPTVSRWIGQSKQMPAEYVLLAERLTGVPRHLLRPDIYPVDLPPAPNWCGVDLDAGPIVFPGRDTRNGNRQTFLDSGCDRGAAA